VTALTALTFGPAIAVVRFAAALAIAGTLRRRTCTLETPAIGELASLLPYASIAGIVAGVLPNALHLHFGVMTGIIAGLGLGFLAPCALGAVAIAGTLRHVSVAASIAMLAVSGICDLRAFRSASSAHGDHDFFAYGMSAAACAWLAAAHGGTLLNPRFTTGLWLSATALILLAAVHRKQRCARVRWAPLVMVAGIVCCHTSPAYTITETTLADASAGDAVSFRGMLTRHGGAAALVRYAITCCRADAQPVVIRLTQPLRETDGEWFAVRGRLLNEPFGLALKVEKYRHTDAPADPFIYR